MGEQSAISWTNHTFNPWWGCWKIAEECRNCYADATAHRYESQHGVLWGRTAARRFFGEKHWSEPHKWNRRAEQTGVRERVFVASMADWAERHAVPEIDRQLDAYRGRMWDLIDRCRSLDWLMLTKRIDTAREMLPWWSPDPGLIGAPWPHVWLGVTCGTRASLPLVHRLREVPAAVRFVSGEPLLEHISRDEWAVAIGPNRYTGSKIDMLIIGDESGHERRPAQPDWVRSAREAAVANGVRFHFKQWNGDETGGITGRLGKHRKIHLPMLDGKQWAQLPTTRTED